MKKTYCAPDLGIQYVSLHSAIMSALPGASGDQDQNSGGLGVPTRLYI